MFPYILLTFIPLLFAMISIDRSHTGNLVVLMGRGPQIQRKNLLLSVFFVLFFLLLVLRHETVGSDVRNYRIHFETAAAGNFADAWHKSGDRLYNLLMWAMTRMTDNYRFFMILVAALILLPIASLYNEDRSFSILKMALFLNMPTFIMIFSGFRQALAFAAGVCAYRCVREKKLPGFLLWACIASGLHHSGFIVFFFYPLYYMTFKKKHLWFVVPSLAIVYVFNRPIFSAATAVLNRLLGEDYSAAIQDTGAYTMLMLFTLFAVFSYVLPDEKHMDAETLGLRNFLLMTVVIQCFAPLHTLAMRMNYYFVLFIPVLIPKILKSCKPSLRNVGQIAAWVFTIFFLLYYLDKAYGFCVNGNSSLNTYPYIPFWEERYF